MGRLTQSAVELFESARSRRDSALVKIPLKAGGPERIGSLAKTPMEARLPQEQAQFVSRQTSCPSARTTAGQSAPVQPRELASALFFGQVLEAIRVTRSSPLSAPRL
jgi:hypothetical protein